MRLPDHRPALCVNVQLPRWKLRFNVLQHVLGFLYPRRLRSHEGWSDVIAIDPGLVDRVEAALVALSVLVPNSNAGATREDLERFADDPMIAQLIDPGLVPAYQDAISRTVSDWTDDWHREGEYDLVDARGSVCCGIICEDDTIRLRTAYRYTHHGGRSCLNMTQQQRADCAYTQRHGRRHFVHHSRAAR